MVTSCSEMWTREKRVSAMWHAGWPLDDLGWPIPGSRLRPAVAMETPDPHGERSKEYFGLSPHCVSNMALHLVRAWTQIDPVPFKRESASGWKSNMLLFLFSLAWYNISIRYTLSQCVNYGHIVWSQGDFNVCSAVMRTGSYNCTPLMFYCVFLFVCLSVNTEYNNIPHPLNGNGQCKDKI